VGQRASRLELRTHVGDEDEGVVPAPGADDEAARDEAQGDEEGGKGGWDDDCADDAGHL
jgi:hypothetical protein